MVGDEGMARAMDFTEYMRATGKSNAEMSRQLKVDPSYVSILSAGKRHPSLEICLRVEKATGQTVMLEDWIIRRRQNPRPWAGDDGTPTTG